MTVTFFTVTRENLDLNVSNHHASTIFELLGITEEVVEDLWCAQLPAEDFLGRVLVAQALAGHDEGMPGHVVETVLGMAVLAPRREGYFDQRLAQLRSLAEAGVQDGKPIGWG